MIVCVCQNITEETIQKDINDGLNISQICKKYGCNQCIACIPYIRKMWLVGQESVGQINGMNIPV